MLKLLVKIVVCKLQSLTLLVTGKKVLLVHCIVQNVPISLLHQEMTYIITLARNTVFQDFKNVQV